MMKTTIALAAIGLLLAANTASAQAPPRTRGTITAVNGDTIELKTRQGAVLTVTLEATSKVLGVTHAQLSDIKPNSFIGTATAPQQDGPLRALEVTVFPESMRGTGEGHYDWDLGRSSTMTNGAVGSLVGSKGRTMTVTYKGGEKQVFVPADVPVVDIEPGTRALLAPGVRVVVFGPKGPDGKVDGKMVVAGENGVAPPM
jgi:hypothetical protein